MDLKSRLARLESTAQRERTGRTLVLLYGEPEPDVQPDDVIVRVLNEETRGLVLRLINGETVNGLEEPT